jgi:hypothetical protein
MWSQGEAMQELHRGPGVYVVSLTNEHPISVNADRPGIADRCIKVNRDNCKFGKALNLQARARNYGKTFGPHYVRFFAVAAVSTPAVVESIVGAELMPFRMRGATGRPNEWLAGMTASQVQEVVIEALKRSGLDYRLLL